MVNSSQLARALAERNGLDFVDLNEFEVDHGAAHLVDPGKARRSRTIPIAFTGERTLLVATADPANVVALDDIQMATGYEVRRAVASAEDIDSVIAQLSRLDESVQEMDEAEEEDPAQVIELRESADDAPVVKLVHTVIADAVTRGASDIHFEPRQGDMRVRFRIDGVVSDSTTVPRHLVAGLVSRVKIMSDLNIAERRAPQDGRVGLTVDGRRIDLRVATLPVMRGEAVVMRILDAGQSMTTIDALGMGADRPHALREVAARQDPRRHPRDRPDGLGQDHDALRGPRRPQHARQDHRDHRGPGGVRAGGHQAGPGERRRPASASRRDCARWSEPTRT